MSEGSGAPEEVQKNQDQTDSLKTPEQNPDWKQEITEGIDNQFDNFELFHEAMSFEQEEGDPVETPPAPFDFTPRSITETDDRTLTQLSDEERTFINTSVFNRLKNIGLDPNTAIPTRAYSFVSPNENEWVGSAKVVVFSTDKSGEGLFVHRITYPDGVDEYVLASEEYTL